MLSKQDYMNYLSEMERIEDRMVELYKECSEKVQTPEIKRTCQALMEAEKGHGDFLERLKEILLK